MKWVLIYWELAHAPPPSGGYAESMQLPSREHLTPFAHAAHNRCFGCGPANPIGLRLEFLLAPDGSVVCPVTIPNTFEGRAGYLHGGIIATLLDEAMSKAVRAKGRSSMTRKMEVEFLSPVHSGAPIRIEGRVARHEHRKFWAEACIFSAENKILASATGLFIEVPQKS